MTNNENSMGRSHRATEGIEQRQVKAHSVISGPLDHHYTTGFLAELWGLSTDTILRWFQDEPGVLKLSKLSRKGVRTRVELRIPLSVANRVHSERSK